MTTARGIRSPYGSYSSLDRVALRLGLALVTWSRRPRTVPLTTGPHQRIVVSGTMTAAHEFAAAWLYNRVR
jgi:hypothetical protein